MKPFTLLVGLAALAVAGCAAFFSVTGLALLFSGASLAVGVMGASLEIAKLVAASYLHQYWEETNKLLRTYLLLGVVTLVIITSAGIFGFLSNAYQSTSLKSDVVNREIGIYDNKITQNKEQITQLTTQITNLQQNSGNLLGSGKVNNRLIRSIDNRDKQISKLSNKISVLNDSIAVWNIKINEIRNNNLDLEREIGGFKFIAEAFDLPINSVVKFFIFLLIFVFDPMAVTLIIAFNTAVSTERGEKRKKREERLAEMMENDEKLGLYEIYGDDLEETDHVTDHVTDVVTDQVEETEVPEESVSITPKTSYYMADDFDWSDRKLWINDRSAIKYWMRFKNGNQKDLDRIKNNNEDFTSKSY